MHLISVFFIATLPSASGFLNNLFQVPAARPDLIEVTEQQDETKLNIQLHLGNLDQGQLTISNFVVELHHDHAEYDHVELPGADGQHRKLSSGHRRLDVISRGHYVDLKGTKYVAAEKGCWEMCWRKGRPAGTMVCGFELPEEYTRNAAKLPKGIMYLSFPIWTREGLKIGQEEKIKVEEKILEYVHERDYELYLSEVTDNPIMQAIHHRNAEAACEKYAALPHDTLDSIPNDNQVVNLQDDLLLTTKGQIFFKHPGNDSEGHEFLGLATVSLETNHKRLMP